MVNNFFTKESFFWSPKYLNTSAWVEHIPFAFWIVEILKPKIIVELGVHNAVSYFSFCQAVKRLDLDAACYGIDTWNGDEHTGFYDEEVFRNCTNYNNQEYSRFSTLIRSTFDEAKDYFIDGTIDILHVDGLHTYEAVKQDFETWLPKLSPSSIVIFHDINVRERNFGVFKFWEELKEKYNHFQFDFGNGLGIISIGKVSKEEILLLNNKKDDYYIFLRNLFSDRGFSFKKKMETTFLISELSETFEKKNKESLILNEKKELSIAIDQVKEDNINLKLIIIEIKNNETKLLTNIDNIFEIVKKLELNNVTLQRTALEHSTYIKLNDTNILNNDEKHKELLNLIKHQQDTIEWYKSTYENRSFLGLIKENLLRKKKILTKSPNQLNNFSANRTLNNIIPSVKNIVPFPLSISKIKKKKYHLNPINDMITSNNSDVYTSIGIDPYFKVEFKKKYLKAGWYWLSMEIIEVEGILFAPKLYFNYGKGFTEKEGWNLPTIEYGKIQCLINIPFNVVELRFDPTTTKSIFKIKDFKLKYISKIKALQIGVSLYKRKYFPLETNSSFYKGLMETVLKTGSVELREKIRHTIYVNGTNTWDKYKHWCSLYDTISKDKYDKIVSLSNQLSYQPLFSIIMPVYNAPISFLKKAIDSVINQPYKNWELCIADDFSTNEDVRLLLEKYTQKDKRIKIVFRKTNGHISNASNSALKLATGEYIVLLDQDDELSVHCLYMVAKTINKNKDLGIIYSDEDKMDEYGNRFDPYFKTNWNKYLFYGQNMISHLGVYKLSLIKKIGGFRVGYEGSQDYDLALRCMEILKPEQIYHIPHILYHWRAIKGSTAITTSNKDYAHNAGKRALEDHFIRTNQNATLVKTISNSYRIKWGMPKKRPLVSIIIPTKDKVDILSTCVASILEKTLYSNYEILLIDNNSEELNTHTYFQQIQKDNKQIKVFAYNEEFNFSAMNNFGVKQSKGEIVVLLNNDTSIINNDWLCEMVSLCLRKDIGAVGAKLFYPNGLIQHAGVILHEGHPGNHIYINREKNDPGYFNKLNLIQNYVAVTAACLAVRKELYLKVGGLDEKNLKIAYNDVDFCLKLYTSGYQNIWTPFAQLIHYESLSRGNDLDEINYPRFKKEQSFILNKWQTLISNDPFFNPNLGVETITTQFSFPPKIRYEWNDFIDSE